MYLLEVNASGFKGCDNNFNISFLPRANKTDADKEFELIEIDDELYIFSTLAIIGKNASGKTSAVDLLGLVYDLFSNFRINSMRKRFIIWNKEVSLDITFYYEKKLYRYKTKIKIMDGISKSIIFENQELLVRPYFKTYIKDNSLLDYSKYNKVENANQLPLDVSILFNLFGKMDIYGIYYSIKEDKFIDYANTFELYKSLPDSSNLLPSIIQLFDDSLKKIKMINGDKYEITYNNDTKKTYTLLELEDLLSSGTAKGFDLFTTVVYSLKFGSALIIDEIENHFHKTLVDNLINLYKDKTVNKKGAVLVFTTHYCELLDLFNRSDNIYITKHKEKIIIENMYEKYGTRNDLLKSKRFYKNAFGTNVNYDLLMNFKKELMK